MAEVSTIRVWRTARPSARTRSEARPEIKSLTSLRGIAACLVVLSHLQGQFAVIAEIGAYTSIVDYGWIMVDFFFLLSGFVLMVAYSAQFDTGISAKNYFNFMQNRLARVYPLHLFMLLCFLALECGKYVYLPGNLDPPFSKNYPSSIVTNLLLIQAWGFDSDQTWNWASWSISAEFAAYILFPFIVLGIGRLAPVANVVLAAVAIAALYGIKHTIGHGSTDLTYNFGILRCLPSFILGVITFNMLSLAHRKTTSFIASDGLLYASMALCILLLHGKANELLVIPSFAVLVGAASLNTSSHGSRLLSGAPLYFLGTISYSIYMTHSLIIRVWRLAMTRITHDSLSSMLSIVLIGLLLVVIVLVSWLTFSYIERPGRRLLRAR